MQTTLNPMIPLTQIVRRSLDWLWPNRLALGKLAMFDGDPGRGKSLVTLDLCARVTNGRPMPDGTGAAPPAAVAIIQGEDYADDTVAPRLVSLGADLQRVFIFGDDILRKRAFSLPSQIAMLDEALRANSPRLLIIDPIMAFLDGDIQSGSDQSIRRALSPLAELADKHRCAVILVRHMNKNASLRSMYRGIPTRDRRFHGEFPRLDVSDALDFNRRSAGQILCRDRRPGRRVRGKVGVVHLIHGGEIRDIGKEHGTLQHLVHGGAGGFQTTFRFSRHCFT